MNISITIFPQSCLNLPRNCDWLDVITLHDLSTEVYGRQSIVHSHKGEFLTVSRPLGKGNFVVLISVLHTLVEVHIHAHKAIAKVIAMK
jgi:hypothetical protein